MSWNASTRTFKWTNAGPAGTYYVKFWVTNGSVAGGAQNGAMDAILAQITVTSSSPERSGMPSKVQLQQAPLVFGPNPTRGEFVVLTPARREAATLEIFDVRGRLVSRDFQAAADRVVWDGKDRLGMAAGPGVYLYRLRVGTDLREGRVVVVK